MTRASERTPASGSRTSGTRGRAWAFVLEARADPTIELRTNFVTVERVVLRWLSPKALVLAVLNRKGFSAETKVLATHEIRR